MRDSRASRAAKDIEVRIAPTDGVLVVEDLPGVPKGDTPKNWNKDHSIGNLSLNIMLNRVIA